MKYFGLLVVLGCRIYLGLGHKANLDISNGLKTAVLTFANKDLIKIGSPKRF